MSDKKKVEKELDQEEYFLTLDFDGEEVECAIIDEFEMDGKNYIVLLPEDEEEAYIYSYTETEDGEMTLDNLEEDEFKKAADFYMEQNSIDE
ncbi:MAG: DUF1292 domain-containing protein [Candidatus Stygibacter frigidus]|nr:DUF1292 domain-containing protein [Candidatus Stygibacter frigidus]